MIWYFQKLYFPQIFFFSLFSPSFPFPISKPFETQLYTGLIFVVEHSAWRQMKENYQIILPCRFHPKEQSVNWVSKLCHKKIKTMFLWNASKSRRLTSSFFPIKTIYVIKLPQCHMINCFHFRLSKRRWFLASWRASIFSTSSRRTTKMRTATSSGLAMARRRQRPRWPTKWKLWGWWRRRRWETGTPLNTRI